MNDKEFLDMIHTNIHGLRMMPSYKPSVFEQTLNKMIAEHYEKKCKDCAERLMKLKWQAEQPKQGGIGGLFK